MAWFRICDTLGSHPKTLSISPRHRMRAVGLFALLGAWCSKHLTDGVFTMRSVRDCGGTAKDLQRLCEAGFAAKQGDCYVLVNYLSKNPSREEVKAKREGTAQRVRKHRARNAVTNTDTAGGSNAPPIPSHPIPLHPSGVTPAKPLRGAGWRQVGVAFNREYEQRAGGPIALDLHRESFEAIWLQANRELDAVTKALQHFFADEYASGLTWPPGLLAKQFGKYLQGPRSRQSREEQMTQAMREGRVAALKEMGVPID